MAKVVRPTNLTGKIGEALMPRRRDMVLYQGDDFDILVSFKTADGTPLNMYGWSARCYFKKASDSSITHAEVNISEDSLSLTLALPSESTSKMLGKYVYDLELTNPTGKKKTYMYGEAEVIPEVTKGA